LSAFRRPLRRRKPTKRLDLSDLRKALGDAPMHAYAGVVFKPEGASSHYQLVRQDGTITDVLVEVQTYPSRQDLTCKLSTMAGGPGAGLWRIPPVGTRVAVLVPEGAMDFQPTIVGILDDPPDRVSTDRTVLVAPDKIEVSAPKIEIGRDVGTQVLIGPNPDSLTPLDGAATGKSVDSFGNPIKPVSAWVLVTQV